METLKYLLQYLLHIDQYLIAFVSLYGIWTYVVLFMIIFCETGLIILPFLPGDSLLFAAGSIASNPNQVLDIKLLFLLLVIASVLGNKINFIVGKLIGPRVFQYANRINSKEKTRLSKFFFNPKHLIDAHQFYEKHGGKTIIMARFVPILRTFVPFIAGVCEMNLSKFTFYNILSSLMWIGSLLAAGYYFGNLPSVQQNFSLVIYAVIIISLLPPFFMYLYRKLLSTV
jgi:membrane-associated protein